MTHIHILHSTHRAIQVSRIVKKTNTIAFHIYINSHLAADPALHDGYWGPWKTKPNDWPRLFMYEDEDNSVY